MFDHIPQEVCLEVGGTEDHQSELLKIGGIDDQNDGLRTQIWMLAPSDRLFLEAAVYPDPALADLCGDLLLRLLPSGIGFPQLGWLPCLPLSQLEFLAADLTLVPLFPIPFPDFLTPV